MLIRQPLDFLIGRVCCAAGHHQWMPVLKPPNYDNATIQCGYCKKPAPAGTKLDPRYYPNR